MGGRELGGGLDSGYCAVTWSQHGLLIRLVAVGLRAWRVVAG